MSESCAVCESPTAKSFHFGAKSCKACAAFFRRAVALSVSYICKGGKVCLIHHERRYMCKSCRYDKCFQQGMQKELVQSKGKLCEREKMERTSSTPPTPTFDVPSVPSCSKDGFQVANFYAKLEAALNDRRKVMYTNLKLKDILSDNLAEVPFTKDCLKIFDYRTWRGLERKDFTMLFDNVRSMPQFGDLCKEEQGILYRYTVVVDALLGGSYLSSRMTYAEKWLIMVDCTYYPMDPAPLTGNEPDAHMHFQTREDFEKYKSLVVPMAENWTSLVEPMHALRPSFHEYALLKALVCWHICHYKFQPQGKTICANQRNAILQAFFTLYDRDDEAAVLRLGEFLLFISNIFERVYDLVTSLYMVTFFEIVDTDPFTVDLLNQNAL